VIGMQGENRVERMHDHRIRHVFLAGRAEHHVHEVGGIAEVVARIHEGFAARVAVGERDDCRHLGDDAVEVYIARLRVEEAFLGFVIEGRQCADDADHDRHRVRVATEALVELGHLLVDHRVTLDDLDEVDLLLGRRQVAMLEQVGDVKEVAVLGEFFDRITAIQEFALVAVDKRDLRFAGRRRQKAGVIGKQAGLGRQRPHIDAVVAMDRTYDRKLDRFLVVDRQHHLTPFSHLSLPLKNL